MDRVVGGLGTWQPKEKKDDEDSGNFLIFHNHWFLGENKSMNYKYKRLRVEPFMTH